MMNLEKLTPEQRSRYEWALAEYNRIQERNLVSDATTIAHGVLPIIKHVPNPKSSLFARLLDGKAPLLFPPPTSFSYPWYQLIEDGFSDNVSLDGFVDLYGDKPDTGVALNQALWKIMLNNAAAKSLMQLSKKVAKTKNLVLNLHESMEAKQILLQKPEWIVKYGRNPEFRLFLSRVKRRGRKDLLMTELLQRDFSGGNPKIVQTLIEPASTPQPAGPASGSSTSMSKQSLIDRITEIQSQMTADNDRNRHEWVLVECDAWCLETVTS
jgi:hypothetical protein